MMWVVYCFAAVGLLTVVCLVVRWLGSVGLGHGAHRHPFIPVVVAVRNRGEWIEGLLRQLLSPTMVGGEPGFDWEVIVVVDNGSQDDTRQILTRLSREYPALHPHFRDDVTAADDGWSAVAPAPIAILIDLQQSADVAEIQTAMNRLLRPSVAVRR